MRNGLCRNFTPRNERHSAARRRQDACDEAKVANPQLETETHRAALTEFRNQANERQPRLAVETGLMGLDGKVEMFI